LQEHDLKSDALSAAVPKVLLTDTDRRPYAARMALELANAGCEVSAICSMHGHPLLKTGVVRQVYPYSALRPLDSLIRAIEEIGPNLVIPCDDRGVRHLHELYVWAIQQGFAAKGMAELIERSLGSPESYPVVSARYELLMVADEEGFRVPQTELVRELRDLEAWQATHTFPWVLKADGTWGGRGVRIVNTPEEAERFFREVSSPVRLRRVIKRMCVNRDPFWFEPWWESRKPAVIVQTHVQGSPANCGVVAWKGKVLGGIGVEVVSADGLTGPASVVRVVKNSKMMCCAERIARRLNLSGFFGLDFIIEAGTGEPYLIEMNPRCTPVSHLRLGKDHDMIGALWAQLAEQPVPQIPTVTENDMIAYFPQAWNCKSEFLQFCFQDIPQGKPDLIEEFLRPWPERSFLFQLTLGMQRAKELAAATLHTSRSS
jgi:ATP-grasp domain